jgi:hypothetical protein
MIQKQSKFPYFSLSMCLLVMTLILISIYAKLHWPIMSGSYQIKAVGEIYQNQHNKNELHADSLIQKVLTANSRVIASSRQAMKTASLYHVSGLSCLIVSIFGVVRLKGGNKYFLIPIGFLGALLGLIFM